MMHGFSDRQDAEAPAASQLSSGFAGLAGTCSAGTTSTSQWTCSGPARGWNIVLVRWPGARTGWVSRIAVDSALPTRRSASNAASAGSCG